MLGLQEIMNKSASPGCGQRFFASERRGVSNKASESRLGIELVYATSAVNHLQNSRLI